MATIRAYDATSLEIPAQYTYQGPNIIENLPVGRQIYLHFHALTRQTSPNS